MYSFKKAFSLIELAVVSSIVAVLGAVAVTLYTDYVRKAKTAEAPDMLRSIAQAQVVYKNDPRRGAGKYAYSAADLFSNTVNEMLYGRYYRFGANKNICCGANQNEDFAYAIALVPTEMTTDGHFLCMSENFTIYKRGTGNYSGIGVDSSCLSGDNGGGNNGKGPGGNNGKGPGGNNGKGPGDNNGKGPGGNNGKGPGDNNGKGPGDNNGKGPGDNNGKGPGDNNGKGQGGNNGKGPGGNKGKGN